VFQITSNVIVQPVPMHDIARDNDMRAGVSDSVVGNITCIYLCLKFCGFVKLSAIEIQVFNSYILSYSNDHA